MKSQTHFLHTPPGSKPLYREEALFRNCIEKELGAYFEQWSYFPVETPIIDYFDIYSPFLSEKQKKGSLRFINRDGDLILLRNDITLFAAKALAARGTGIEDTLRYYYSGQIVRCQAKDSPEEYYQIGCEIVASNFKYEEIELLSVLIESAEKMGLKDYLVHIGDISLFNDLLSGFDKDIIDKLLLFIRVRDIQSLEETLIESGAEKDLINDILLIAGFIGNLNEFKALNISQKALKSSESLCRICDELSKLGYEERIILDPSELSDLGYYNGIIFHMYAKGAETPIASGGRYDHLFEYLGVKRNAVGFSYWLYPLEKLLNESYSGNNQYKEICVSGDDFTKDFKNAVSSVRNGEKINIKY